MDARIEKLLGQFHTLFGEKDARIWSAPGRTEIGGNHTDHQLGKVVAASVDMDMLAAAAANGTNTVNVKSEGYDMISFTLDTLTPVKRAALTPASPPTSCRAAVFLPRRPLRSSSARWSTACSAAVLSPPPILPSWARRLRTSSMASPAA